MATNGSVSEYCPFCNSSLSRIKYDLGSHQIVKCQSCGLMRLFPMPSANDTESVYSDIAYYENPNFYDVTHGNLYGYKDYIAERLNRQRSYRPIAEFLRDRHGLPRTLGTGKSEKPRLLDIGCGLGYFLDVAQDVGFDVRGVEFNPGAVRAIQEKYSFPVFKGSVYSIPPSERPFDVVVMFDVIEHLHDPFQDIKRIYSLLRPGGGLAISTMDSESFTSRLLGKRLEDFRRTQEHLFFFSRETLTKVLEAYGFRVYDLKSWGHTFELGFLLERLAIYNRPVFLSARWLANHLGLGKWPVSVDLHTKMIAYALKPHDAD